MRAWTNTDGRPSPTQCAARIAVCLLTASILPIAKAGAQGQDVTLRMPATWNDAYFEKLENLKPNTVVAVTNFSCGDPIKEQLCSRMAQRLASVLVQTGRVQFASL